MGDLKTKWKAHNVRREDLRGTGQGVGPFAVAIQGNPNMVGGCRESVMSATPFLVR